MTFWYCAVVWLASGYVLGHFYSVRLKNASMTIHDLVCNSLAGPFHLVTIYLHFKDTVVVKSSAAKGLSQPAPAAPPAPKTEGTPT